MEERKERKDENGRETKRKEWQWRKGKRGRVDG